MAEMMRMAAAVVAAAGEGEGASAFSLLSDDIVINIFLKIEGDPRDWARLACVCSRFSAIVHNVCYRSKVSRSIPSVISDLLFPLHPSPDADGGGGPPAGVWAALHKLSVCCPGLLHAGLLLENSDFGLEREIGPDQNHVRLGEASPSSLPPPSSSASSSASSTAGAHAATAPPADCAWSLFDDLYFDTLCDASESTAAGEPSEADGGEKHPDQPAVKSGWHLIRKRKRHWDGPQGAHLAAGGAWSLSREQGNKLLASRFRGDSLYISDWPGCVHAEGKRKYMLFRGVFRDFKRSCVWRSIGEGGRTRTGLDCAFCACRSTWDLHSAFCLRRVFGYHDDGEPEVRAYVCENGHVSGAWTERPLYT